MADNRFDLELGLDFSKVTEALQQIKSQFTGTDAAFQKIANSFKNSFNTMTNAIKLYGMESSQARTATKAMEKAMVELTKNGVDPASLGFQQLSSQIGPLATKINEAGNSVKKNNMQWTNLALVIQDLPFGFRGIQNNLPALIGSFAGATGAIYLAGSAIIALFTAMDLGIIKFGNSVKLTTNFSKEAATAYSSETVQLESLYRVATDSNKSMTDRLDAAKELKNQYPGLLGVYSEEEIALGKAKTAYNELTTTIWQYALAQAATKALEEIAAKKLPLMIEKTKLLAQERKLAAIEDAQGVQQGIGVYSKYSSQLENVRQKIKDNTEEQKGLAKAAADYTPVIDANINALSRLDKFKSKDKDAIKAAKDALKAEKEKARLINAANEAETKAYIGTLDERGQKEYQAGLELASNLEKMKAAGYTDSTTYYAQYRQSMLDIAKHYDDIEYKRNQDSINANIAFETKIYQDSNRAFDKIKKEQLDSQIAFAKRQTNSIETELNVQDKLNKNNLKLRIEDTKQALAKLAALAAFTFDPKVLAVYLDAFDKITAKLKGLGTEWDKTAKSINSIVLDLINNSIFLLADSLGKAFAGESVDIFNSFGLLIADALTSVGKALIEYATLVGIVMELFSNPLTWPVALAVGFAAVAAGAFLKSTLTKKDTKGVSKFADGGIVSGPTMGLMGEYPGAKSNPEVIAPLDKLKDLIGGGGGTLEARISGNDLLILMNKAQRNNNTTF